MSLTIKTAEDRQAEALAVHKARVTNAVDQHIEAQARAMQYNSAAHLASYIASAVPLWRAEAHAFVAWRDACWVAVLRMLAQAQKTGVVPGVDDVITALPEWEGSVEE